MLPPFTQPGQPEEDEDRRRSQTGATTGLTTETYERPPDDCRRALRRVARVARVGARVGIRTSDLLVMSRAPDVSVRLTGVLHLVMTRTITLAPSHPYRAGPAGFQNVAHAADQR